MFQSLSLEQMQIIDENNVKGIVRLKMLFFTLPLRLTIAMENVNPPAGLEAKVCARTSPGLITTTQTTRIRLAPVQDGKTEVVASVDLTKMPLFFRLFLLWKMKSYTAMVLSNIQSYIERAV